MTASRSTQTRKLDRAELWMRDGLTVCNQPAYHQSIEVDVTRVKSEIESARRSGIRITYSNVLVRVAALALADNPDLHALVCGSRIHYPSSVDIALSVSAETCISPVLILEGVEQKSVQAIATEVVARLPEAQENHRKMLALLNGWGWLLPFGTLRRAVLRILHHSFDFRRKGSGTFQVSIVPGVDRFVTSVFNSSAVLTAGRVKDRVMAIGGVPVVRPTINLTCSADHRVWNGEACQRYLLAVQELLEGNRLANEFTPREAFAMAPDSGSSV